MAAAGWTERLFTNQVLAGRPAENKEQARSRKGRRASKREISWLIPAEEEGSWRVQQMLADHEEHDGRLT
jgi:hypothetical protein